MPSLVTVHIFSPAMKENPLTLEDEKKQRYGCWAGNPNGSPFNPKYCACHAMSSGRAALPIQCHKSPGHGPENIYCSSHANQLFPKSEGTAYRVCKYRLEVEAVEYSKLTASRISVIEKGRSTTFALKSQGEAFFTSINAAKEFIIMTAEGRIRTSEEEIRKSRAAIEYANSL